MSKVSTTSEAELQTWMRNSIVKSVFVEVLKTDQLAANPDLRSMGKEKNHWVLRLGIRHAFKYRRGGVSRECKSIRASVELPEDGSLVCREVDLKAMPNDAQMSHSANAMYLFDLGRSDPKVQDLVDIARPLLPFQYMVVSRTLQSSGKSSSGRDKELLEHPNGCPDFTAQWFYRLHKAGYIEWETTMAQGAKGITPLKASEGFHDIIGYRYSRGAVRTDPCKIAMAKFPPAYQRQV